MRKIVFGHSIAAGFMDPQGGWTTRISREMNSDILEGPDDLFELYNLAVSGFTTEEVCKQIPGELELRSNETETAVIIQIGMNDPLFLRDEGRYKVSRKNFRENLEYLIDKTRGMTDNLYIMGEPPVNINGILPWSENERLDRQDLIDYEEIKRELCIRRGVEFIDLRKRLPEKYEQNLVDGLHPNENGHQMIANIVKDEIQRPI